MLERQLEGIAKAAEEEGKYGGYPTSIDVTWVKPWSRPAASLHKLPAV